MERLWFQLVLEPCFVSNISGYKNLMHQWMKLLTKFPSWSLETIKDLSPRERLNWLALAKEYEV